jgi:hypothetical protein
LRPQVRTLSLPWRLQGGFRSTIASSLQRNIDARRQFHLIERFGKNANSARVHELSLDGLITSSGHEDDWNLVPNRSEEIANSRFATWHVYVADNAANVAFGWARQKLADGRKLHRFETHRSDKALNAIADQCLVINDCYDTIAHDETPGQH